jgi:hypothetical protein
LDKYEETLSLLFKKKLKSVAKKNSAKKLKKIFHCYFWKANATTYEITWSRDSMDVLS